MLVTADVDGVSWAEEDKRPGMPLGLSWKTTSLRSPISLPMLLIQRYHYGYSCPVVKEALFCHPQNIFVAKHTLDPSSLKKCLGQSSHK